MSDQTKIILPNKVSKERNKKVMERALWTNKEVKEMRESFKTKMGYDMKDAEKFPVMKESFSWSKVRAKLRETGSASTFPQVLRAGVQTMVNNSYEVVESTHEDWVHVVQSDKDTELYAPLHGISFLSEVGRQEKYQEAAALGLDIKLNNKKYGQIFPVEKELLNDDQTGQFQNQVALMAEYAKVGLEVLCYGKLASVANMAYSSLAIPVSETKPSTESNYPWTLSSAPFVGGGFNKATPAVFNLANFQSARTSMRKQLNLLGLKMVVRPKRLVVSPLYELDATTILNSNYYPAGAAAAGSTGGAFAVNFLKGVADLTVADYLFDNTGAISGLSKAWYLMDDKPAFVLQIRQPALVEMENPEAGESFDRDVVRHKLSFRANADFIDPRFYFQGSDGSV